MLGLIILIILSLILAMTSVKALPLYNTTCFVGNASKDSADFRHTIGGKTYEGYIDFANMGGNDINRSMLFTKTANGDFTDYDYNVTNGYLNISSKTVTNQPYTIATGINFTPFKRGMCVDINFSIHRFPASGANDMVIITDILTSSEAGEEVKVGFVGQTRFEVGANNEIFQILDWIPAYTADRVVNLTICKTNEFFIDSNTNNYNFSLNSTLDNSQRYDFGSDVNQNISFWIGNKNDELRIYSVRVYNRTTGCPTVPLSSVITNSSASLAINTPLNNSQTHNATPFINFTISTSAPNLNFSWQMFFDGNSNPTTRINASGNRTAGTFTFSEFTLITETASSINGTYYLKINGTDNASNVFSQLITLNLTNDINQYNATNVSINGTAINPNNQLKCFYNLTNKVTNNYQYINQTDNISITDLRWWVNKTLMAGNKTILNAENVTNNANISCEVRLNAGFGETSWTQYVNSSMVTIGDTANPALTVCLLSASITNTAGNTINFTCNATDNNIVNSMGFDINGTLNTTRSFSFGAGSAISAIYEIFKSIESLVAGSYSIMNVSVTDGSSNKLVNSTNFHFSVTQAGGGGSSGGGGGGGGGGGPPLKIIVVNQTNVTFTPNCNFNSKCEGKNGEDPFGCPSDCKLNTNFLFCDDPTQKCIINLFDPANKTFRFITVLALGSIFYLGISQARKRKT